MEKKELSALCLKQLLWIMDDIQGTRKKLLPQVEKSKKIDELHRELIGTFELCLKGMK
jgi:hypothetical protein